MLYKLLKFDKKSTETANNDQSSNVKVAHKLVVWQQHYKLKIFILVQVKSALQVKRKRLHIQSK